MRAAGVALVIVLGAAFVAVAVAGVRVQHVTVGLDGSAGALHLGMSRQDAWRVLGPGAGAISFDGIQCAFYDYGAGGNRGGAAACFDSRRRLVALGVGGKVFCFRVSSCLDGHSRISAVRSGFRTTFDSGNGTYYVRRRVRLLAKPYEIVFERPAYDARGTAEGVGFAPCGANRAIGYYIRSDC